jgi:hypothetical protein
VTAIARARALLALCAGVALLVPARRGIAQGATPSRPDSVRGRVTTDSGAVIAGADVIITIAPSTKTVRQATDSTGHYAMAIADGTGEYILYIGAAGRKPFRLRLTRIGRDSTFVVDAKLASAITTVAAVKVVAQKPHPSASLSGAVGPGTSGNDKSVDGVNGALPPDLANNTDAMASLIPGLAVGAGGVSAFGMSSDANSHTLNGLNYGGGDLPRDVRTTTRFVTSTWDPTIGEFSGVATQQQLASGDNISRRTAHLTFDSPALQFSDPIASQLGAEYSNIQLSEGGTGAYALDKLYYNYGIQASRRTASIASLADLDAAALSLSGVSRDSAARLIQTLGALHIPVNIAGVSPRLVTNSVSFTERIDHQLPTVPRGSVPLPAWALSTVVSYANSDPSSLSPISPTTTGGTTSSASGFLQGQYTRYFGKDGAYLNEASSALQYSESRGTPYLSLPGGNVLIASALPDGTTGLGALNFGGNGVLARDLKQYSWELKNQTDFLGGGSINLPLKVYLQSRVDGFSQSPSANRLGSFSFPSLDALANNEPSTFSRTLNAPASSGNEWVGAAAFGGTWTHDKLTLTGGLRAEGNAYLTAPAENPAIETLFGARTDHEPNTFAVLPRLGFTYRIPGQQGMAAYMSQISTSYRGPSVIRGGIGEFRGATRPMLLSNAMTSTGLPGGMERLLCTGSATPTPDWQAYAADSAAIPSSCVNSSTLADTAPSVTLLDKHWSPTDSWRATLGYSKTLLATYLSIDANYSLNLHQPGTYDLNFAGAPQFAIADEGGRPVYVSPSNIDPASGAVSSVQSRASPAYGRVVDQRSDLRGDARQLTVYAVPSLPFSFGFVALGYTYADARAQSRGFDQSTAGDPRLVDWSPGVFTPHHTFQLQIGRQIGKLGGLTTSLRVQSGLPFTPLVAGDINGDGLSNDRAFVFNPATATDAGVASGISSLVASGPQAARACLAKQVGQIAGLNSCTGPWTATMNAAFYLSDAVPGTSKRAHVGVTFQNVLGGLDELIHGDNHLQGWGMSPFPDQTLLRVRGFDPGTNSFLYSVNPRFGSTSLATTSQRVPFRITLDVSIDVGHSYAEQQLEQNLRIRAPLKGTHAPLDSVVMRYRRNYSDFYGYLLVRLKDSLALTLDQQRQMQDERDILGKKADSIYTTLAQYLVDLPDGYDRKEAVKRINDADDAMWKDIYAEGPFLVKLLTPGQIHLLPSPIFTMIASPDFKGRFFFGF